MGRINSHRRRARYGPVASEVATTPPPVPGVNVWTHPRDLSDPVWNLDGVTVKTDIASAPDGSTGMDEIEETSATSQHRVWRSMNQAGPNAAQTVACYARQVERSLIEIRSTNFFGAAMATRVDLQTGQVVHNDSEHVATVVNMGNGIWWIKVTRKAATFGPSQATLPFWSFNISTGGSVSYTGAVGKGIQLWDLAYYPNQDGTGIVPAFTPVTTSSILRVNMTGRVTVGTGPDMTTSDPTGPYPVLGVYIPTPSSIVNDIALAEQLDVMLVLKPAGSVSGYVFNKVFDWASYETQVRRFQSIPELRAALQTRRAVFEFFDEPYLTTKFGDPSTVPPSVLNDLGLLHKSIWPGAVTIARMSSKWFKNGWPNINGESGGPPAQYTSRVTGQKTSGWSGIDYGVSQYDPADQNNGTDLATFYANELTTNQSVNVGVVPGVNYIDGGNRVLMSGVQPCWDISDSGTSSGVIVGTVNNTLANGTFLNCGDSRIAQLHSVYASPAWREAALNAVFANPALLAQAPFFTGYNFALGVPAVSVAPYTDLQVRQDIIDSMRRMIAKGKTRSTFAWRTIK